MDHRFDTLAKSLSGTLSRRQAFWRLAGGVATAVLASVGLVRASSRDCGKLCAVCCRNLDPPPRGPEMGACITACHAGLGPCGPLVCPDGQ